jgi:hypothetical protein
MFEWRESAEYPVEMVKQLARAEEQLWWACELLKNPKPDDKEWQEGVNRLLQRVATTTPHEGSPS